MYAGLRAAALLSAPPAPHREGACCGERRSRRCASPRAQPTQRQMSANPQQTSPTTLSRAQVEVVRGRRGSEETAERKSEDRSLPPRTAHRRERCPPDPGRPLPTHRGPRVPALPSVNTAGPTPPSRARGSGRPVRPRPRTGTEPRAAPTSTAQPAEPAAGTGARLVARAAAPRGAGPARTSEAACQAEIHPPQVGREQRKVSPPSARRPRASAAAAPRHNYAIRTRRDFHLLQGAPGIAQGKRPGTRAADVPPSLTEERKAPLCVPETLDYPHRADPAHWLCLTHTRGRGRARRHSNQRAGGRALLRRRPTEGSARPGDSSSRLPPPLSSPFSSPADG